MKKLKLFLTFPTVFALTFLLLVVFASASEIVYDGSYGDVTWKLYSATGELVISGTGEIEDLTYILNGPCDIKSITICEGVTSIGNGAFYGFSDLTSVTLPISITSIGFFAFCECTALTSITIPASVTSIGACAFSYCSSLASITLPASVTSIGGSAFEECTALSSIIIPSGITVIEEYMFYGCTSLASVTIPASVTSIESSAFTGCTALKAVRIDSPTVIGALDSATAVGNLIKNAHIIYMPADISALPVYVQNRYTFHTEILQGGTAYTVRSTLPLTCAQHTEVKHKLLGDNGAVIYADHSFGGWIEHNATQHKKVCECGAAVYADHAYGAWTTVTEATKDAAGLQERSCACGHTDTKEIPRLESNTGVVVAIVSGGTVALGGGGFALYWFVFRKKKRI